MRIEFETLNPMLGGNGKELTFNCPKCGERFPISVNYQGAQQEPATWGLTHPINNFNWNLVTLSPSIANHPQSHKKPKCDAHFSIINGIVV